MNALSGRRVFILAAAFAWLPSVRPVAGQSAWSAAVARGDSLMAAHDARAAIAAYHEGLARQPRDATLLWKTARAITNLTLETPGDPRNEERLAEAVQLARRAVRAGPRISRTHTTLAASIGLYGRLIGYRYRISRAREVIGIARTVHAEAQRAIELDPQDFAPHIVLGIWHRELATLHPLAKVVAKTLLGGYPPASLEESAGYLQRAVRLAPSNVTARIELAKTYLEIGREEAARRELRAALTLPAREKLDDVQQDNARLLLAQIG